MGSPDMTSVSVSFETRRQLNTMRALGEQKSVDDVVKQLIKEHRLRELQEGSNALRAHLEKKEGTELDDLIHYLRLRPWER